MLCDERCSKNVEFEECIGYIGFLIAHEMAHAYDSVGIMYDHRGCYSLWMNEDESEAYSAELQRIVNFFDGKETAYNQKIDGKLIEDETFADILAMKCCLRILQERENPDYDLFFKTLAKLNAYYYTEDGIQKAVADTHLPSKERINYVFGQFDEFYETYDIDESSPYYVPKEERLSNLF
jgi:predicted metalloendopeptidase